MLQDKPRALFVLSVGNAVFGHNDWFSERTIFLDHLVESVWIDLPSHVGLRAVALRLRHILPKEKSPDAEFQKVSAVIIDADIVLLSAGANVEKSFQKIKPQRNSLVARVIGGRGEV